MSAIKRTSLLGYRPSDPSLEVQVMIKPSEEKLTFKKEANGNMSANLALWNATTSPRVAFKIKTTQPKRYLVKPNQGLLDVGEHRDVSVLVAPAKQQEIIDALEEDAEGVELNDRFQVVFVGVDDHFFQVVSQMGEHKAQGEELQHMWDNVSKKDQIGRKLEVEFDLHGSTPTEKPASAAPPAQSLQEKAPAAPVPPKKGPSEGSRSASSTPERGPTQTQAPARMERVPLKIPAASDSMAAFHAITEEMNSLRRKYDDLVAFTVSLTGERDLLVNHLDAVKTELRREVMVTRQLERGETPSLPRDPVLAHKRRSSKASPFGGADIPGITVPRDNIASNAAAAKEAKKRRAPPGYPLYIVALVALIAFFIGRLL